MPRHRKALKNLALTCSQLQKKEIICYGTSKIVVRKKLLYILKSVNFKRDFWYSHKFLVFLYAVHCPIGILLKEYPKSRIKPPSSLISPSALRQNIK